MKKLLCLPFCLIVMLLTGVFHIVTGLFALISVIPVLFWGVLRKGVRGLYGL